MLPGVYKATKKNGQVYYRGNISHNGKHISLGSYQTEEDCFLAYKEAQKILSDSSITLLSYQNRLKYIDFEKCVSLINFRDNSVYIKNPIYLQKNYFIYYLDQSTLLKFDKDDLFYYSDHKIQVRGGHLFVNDYGIQTNILSRYGIIPYSVKDRDYYFANGDDTDFRYSNVILINKYHGVFKETKKGKEKYLAKIHLNGDIIIGRFDSEGEAAIAYNKAIDYCTRQGYKKNFIQNYVTEFSPKEYADIYTEIKLSKTLRYYFQK